MSVNKSERRRVAVAKKFMNDNNITTLDSLMALTKARGVSGGVRCNATPVLLSALARATEGEIVLFKFGCDESMSLIYKGEKVFYTWEMGCSQPEVLVVFLGGNIVT